MTEEQVRLARQLAQADWWEWRSGMRTADGDRLTWLQRDREDLDGFDDAHNAALTAAGLIDGDWWLPAPADIPDLTDSATGGVLLSMLSRIKLYEAGDQDDYWVVYTPAEGGWHAGHVNGDAWRGTTLAEACARALLAVHAVR